MLVPGGDFRRIKLLDAMAANGVGTLRHCTHGDNGAYTAVGLQAVGLVAGESIAMECTVDGTNWVALEIQSVSTSTTTTTSISSDGIYRVIISGLFEIRATLSGYVSGSVTLTGLFVA